MSRTYRDPVRARYFRRVRNEDDYLRERWWLSRHGVEDYAQFLAYSRRDSQENWLSVPSWYKRQQNRLYRAACQEAMRHYDIEASQIPPRKGWGIGRYW